MLGLFGKNDGTKVDESKSDDVKSSDETFTAVFDKYESYNDCNMLSNYIYYEINNDIKRFNCIDDISICVEMESTDHVNKFFEYNSKNPERGITVATRFVGDGSPLETLTKLYNKRASGKKIYFTVDSNLIKNIDLRRECISYIQIQLNTFLSDIKIKGIVLSITFNKNRVPDNVFLHRECFHNSIKCDGRRTELNYVVSKVFTILHENIDIDKLKFYDDLNQEINHKVEVINEKTCKIILYDAPRILTNHSMKYNIESDSYINFTCVYDTKIQLIDELYEHGKNKGKIERIRVKYVY